MTLGGGLGTLPPMRTWLAWGSFALLLVACDDSGGSPCIVDSDCPSFAQVCVDEVCQSAGPNPEAGTRDAGEGRDSGPGGDDAGGGDMDGGEPTDAAPMDGDVADAGSTDGAPVMMCADISGTWRLASILVGCGNATVGRDVMVAQTGGADPCEFALSGADPMDQIVVGAITLAMDGNFAGDLNAGGLGSMACTGTVTGTSMTVACGGACVVTLNQM